MAGPRIAVRAGAPQHRALAREVAAALSAPLMDDMDGMDGMDGMLRPETDGHLDLLFVVDAEGLGVQRPGERTLVRADFSRVADPGAGISRRQPLARAMGREATTVFDATAGLGQDAAMLAATGFEVLAVERSPLVAALLADAMRRARADEAVAAKLGGRLVLQLGLDARQVLEERSEAPDVIYIDPMFPPKRRASALASRRIRLVRVMVGDDLDAAALLALARTRARRRVVVKRPDHAPPLEGVAPASNIATKLVRYDVYPV